MTVKFLKAGRGDSILIQDSKCNILIDGGNDSKYLLTEMDKIHSKNGKIDLVIVTHHDDDHIVGIIDLFKEIKDNRFGERNDFVKRIIFNSELNITAKPDKQDDRLLSYKKTKILEKLIKELSVPWSCLLYTSPSPRD